MPPDGLGFTIGGTRALLVGAMTATPEQIARYVRNHPTFAAYAPRPGYPTGVRMPGILPLLTPPELAEELLEDVGFQTLQLGGFLRTPDGELIASGVELALPGADRRVVELAVDALKLAASKQSDVTPLQAGGLAIVGLAVLWLIVAS
jgi:hypothetical protein